MAICMYCNGTGKAARLVSDRNTISVFGLRGAYLGEAASFGDARKMQEASLPEELREAYAGIGVEGQPLFLSEELTPELCAEYHLGNSNG